MDYRDNRQRWAESHQVVHFYAGQWCTFTPALTPGARCRQRAASCPLPETPLTSCNTDLPRCLHGGTRRRCSPRHEAPTPRSVLTLLSNFNGLGCPTPSNRGIDFKRHSTRLSNPISAGYRRVLRSKKFIQAEGRQKKGAPKPWRSLCQTGALAGGGRPNSLLCSNGCGTRTTTPALPVCGIYRPS